MFSFNSKVIFNAWVARLIGNLLTNEEMYTGKHDLVEIIGTEDDELLELEGIKRPAMMSPRTPDFTNADEYLDIFLRLLNLEKIHEGMFDIPKEVHSLIHTYYMDIPLYSNLDKSYHDNLWKLYTVGSCSSRDLFNSFNPEEVLVYALTMIGFGDHMKTINSFKKYLDEQGITASNILSKETGGKITATETFLAFLLFSPDFIKQEHHVESVTLKPVFLNEDREMYTPESVNETIIGGMDEITLNGNFTDFFKLVNVGLVQAHAENAMNDGVLDESVKGISSALVLTDDISGKSALIDLDLFVAASVLNPYIYKLLIAYIDLVCTLIPVWNGNQSKLN